MAANTTRIDDIVDDAAITQFNQLKAAGKELRTELSQVLQIAIDLNAALGGSTPGQFTKNLKAASDATDSLIRKTNQLQDIELKKAAQQEKIYNSYLIQLSKQEAARQQADAKEIQQAEQKAAKLAAIQARKDAVQFPVSQSAPNPVTAEPDTPSARYEPIITGQENMAISATKSAEAIQVETVAMAEQAEVLAGLSAAQRANLELLLTLQAERAENAAELKALNIEDVASGERAVFLTQRQLELKIAIQQTNLALSQQTKQMLAEDTSGVQMQARLDELRVAIGNLSKAELENVEIGGVWLAEAEKLDLAIKELRDSTGDTTKHVGDYARAQGTASNATILAEKVSAQFVRQLVRMAAQFLLITVIFGAVQALYEWITQLDVFTGRLDKSKQAWDAWSSTMQDASKSAGESVIKLEVLNKAATNLNLTEKDRVKAAEALKELLPDKLKGLSDEAILTGALNDKIKELTDNLEKQAIAEAGFKKLTGIESQIIDQKTLQEKLNNVRDNAFKSIAKGDPLSVGILQTIPGIEKASKQVQREFVNNDINQQLKDSNDTLAVLENTKKVLENNIGLADLAKAAEGKGGGKKTPKPKDTANTDLLEFDRIKLAESQKINKAVLDNEDNSYQVRLVALNKYLADSKALIANSDKIIDADVNLRDQQKINMHLENSNKLKDIDNAAVSEKQKLDKEELEKHKQALEALITADKEHQQEQIEDLEQGATVAAQILQDRRDDALNAKLAAFEKGKISEKKYNRDILAINDQYAIDRLNQELLIQQTILAIQEGTRDSELALAKARGATPEELAKIKGDANKGINSTNNKIASITGDLKNANFKKRSDDGKGGNADAEDKKKALQEALEDAKVVVSDINDLVDSGYENQIAKLEKVGQIIQENAEIEKAAIERSLDTQSNKARAQLILDAQTASAQKAIQQQIAAEKTKQARADKVAAIAEIILNTAIAVSKVTAQTGILGLLTGVPAVIALGALQLAKVVATPIPQFAKGTGLGGHKGGLAIVGEVGPERITEPGKPPYYSPGVATMMNLPRGTVVEPYNMLPQTPRWESTRTDNTDVVNGLNRIERAVSGQAKPGRAKLSGWVEAQRQADAWNRVLANHFR